MTNPHKLLGIGADASEAAIRAAFRRAAFQHHPDRLGGDRKGERQLRRLIAARDYLLNPNRLYARERRLKLPPQSRKMKRTVIAGAFAVAGCVLAFLLISQDHAAPPAMGPFKTVVVSLEEADVPDAGSADIKAIRDQQETLDSERSEIKDWPSHESQAPTHRGGKPSNKNFPLTDAASQFSKTWRRLSFKFQGT